MSNRVELLSRVNVSETNPFLLCNLLARRARQLASGQGVTLCTELINQAAREFVEGTLRYEVNAQEPKSLESGRDSGG
jgi:DNA-directed RNA polymerase subunit K/omega